MNRARRLYANELARTLPMDAEDAVQEIAVRFLTAFGPFDFPSEQSAMAWVLTSLRNQFISDLRKAECQGRLKEDPAFRQAMDPMIQGPSQAITDEEQVSICWRLLEELPGPSRAVFDLELQGLDAPRIAHEMNLSVNAVYLRRSRLRRTLRAQMRRQHRERMKSQRRHG